jgi:hypothetical protein
VSFRKGDRVVVVHDPLDAFGEHDRIDGFPDKSDLGRGGTVTIGVELQSIDRRGPVCVRLDGGGGEHWFGVGCLDFESVVDKLARIE